jgi:hypothetical protein
MPNYWLEITDRPDIGVDLKIPQTDERGDPYWSYSLIHEVSQGDLVLHYRKQDHAIVGISRAIGSVSTAPIIWAAHGTASRNKGSSPINRPGWLLPLTDFRALPKPVTLEAIRAAETRIGKVQTRLRRQGGKYFPFAISAKRPLRPAQGYLTSFPYELLSILGIPVERNAVRGDLLNSQAADIAPGRARVARERALKPYTAAPIGDKYRPADELAAVGNRDPFTVDPEVIERGNHGHAVTQNTLAESLRQSGIEPLSPAPGDPTFDIAWFRGKVLYVAEVKSLTHTNEERQLRLGLGQLLRYRQQLSHRARDVRGVLVAEHEPSDPTWAELCAEVGILLSWPGRFAQVLA